MPGLAKLVVVKKPATKARKGINPFTKEPILGKACSEDSQGPTGEGGIAYFGTYSVVDKVIVEKVEGSTWPNWTGTEQKRPIISLTGDEMKVTVPAASLGGTGEVTFKRVK